MTKYAAHLASFGDVTDSIRQCSALVSDLVDAFPPIRLDPNYRKIAQRLDRFERNCADAQHHGLGTDDNARKLLRDAVNLVCQIGIPASRNNLDPVLAMRLREALEEYKPKWHRHYGLEEGDRVEFRFAGKGVRGVITGFDLTDNNRATMVTDDGKEMDVVCEWCDQLDAYEEPERTAVPAP